MQHHLFLVSQVINPTICKLTLRMNHQLLTTSYLYILLLLLSINLAASSQEEPAKDGIQSTINFEALKNAPKPKERIVGGKTARPGAYPFFAQWMKGCGGSRACLTS